jgi:hypothetical protein
VDLDFVEDAGGEGCGRPAHAVDQDVTIAGGLLRADIASVTSSRTMTNGHWAASSAVRVLVRMKIGLHRGGRRPTNRPVDGAAARDHGAGRRQLVHELDVDAVGATGDPTLVRRGAFEDSPVQGAAVVGGLVRAATNPPRDTDI